MVAEENSIFDEINEELKHDEMVAFFKRHDRAISWTIVLVVLGIVLYSLWSSQKKERLEVTTTSLFHELYTSGKRSDASLDNLAKNAPAEIVPLIKIIKSGRKLMSGEDIKDHAEYLLKLYYMNGVDIVWKDLAMLVFCSYKIEASERLLERLKPLAEEGRPFRYSALEQIAIIRDSMKDYEKALEALDTIISAKDAPQSMKDRITKIRNYLRNNREAQQ
ncbi:MAG: hypothetical protein E7015_03435 [Alphaproteobacteria bacterium]|nr:hypothetical protein [Alphaproteobacteria bacterium]